MNNLRFFIHAANGAFLLSYLVKDIRKLRWLSILGMVLLYPYFFAWGLYEAVLWNTVFLTINLVRLRKSEQEGKGPKANV